MTQRQKAPHTRRIRDLARIVHERGGDLGLVVQNVDLFYYVGSLPKAVLLVAPSGRFLVAVSKGLERARRESTLPSESFVAMKSYRQLPEVAREIGVEAPKTVGLEMDVLPMALGRKLLRGWPEAEAVDVSMAVRGVRSVKDPSEIAAMRQAAQRLREVFRRAGEWIRPGRTELEVVADLEQFMRASGHQGVLRMRGFNAELYYGALGTGRSTGHEHAFDGPVGVAGLYPAVPQFCGPFEIRRNDTFMLDLVFGVEGYVVDAARLYTFGAPSDRVRRAHDVALQILEETAERMVPGAIPEDLYLAASKRAREAKLEDCFMGYGQNQVKFLGHGVGLEVDELPVLAKRFKTPLEAGMTVAVEPKFIFGEEESAGLENTYVVQESGPARSFIQGLDEIQVLG